MCGSQGAFLFLVLVYYSFPTLDFLFLNSDVITTSLLTSHSNSFEHLPVPSTEIFHSHLPFLLFLSNHVFSIHIYIMSHWLVGLSSKNQNFWNILFKHFLFSDQNSTVSSNFRKYLFPVLQN